MATFLACPARNAQVGAAFSPRTRQIRMRQRLALVAIEENDIAGLGLGLAQLKPEPNALDLSRDLPPLQRVPRPPPPEVFFRSALESCDRPISTSSRFLISAMRRGISSSHGSRRALQQRRANPQRSLGLHRRRACIHACLDGLDAAAGEIAAPKTNRILAHGTPRRSAGWSSHQASAIRRAPDPPHRDYAKPPKLRAPLAARHSP